MSVSVPRRGDITFMLTVSYNLAVSLKKPHRFKEFSPSLCSASLAQTVPGKWPGGSLHEELLANVTIIRTNSSVVARSAGFYVCFFFF